MCWMATVLGAVSIVGCSTATPYQPFRHGEGYGDQRIESNRFSIHFAGNSSTSRSTVETYLLYHAAELTLANGYDYFVTDERSTTADTRYYQTFSTGFGYYWLPQSAFDIGTTSYPVTEFDAQADIVMFRGERPATNPQAFDARQVKANLESQIHRPKSD